jgi:hypothetical protein
MIYLAATQNDAYIHTKVYTYRLFLSLKYK